jgi:alpha-glucosidase
MEHHMTRFQTGSLQIAMNELSNHDHSRFLTRTNRKVGRIQSLGAAAANDNVQKGVFREAVLMQMTWPGAPTIYYGDEAGVCGWTDPDSRRTYPWGHEDHELIQFHRDIIKVHKQSEALKTGSLKMIYGAHKLLVYGRFNAKEQYVICVNNNYEDTEVTLPVWQLGVMDGMQLVRLIETNEHGYTVEPKRYEVENNMLHISLKGISGLVLKAI